MNRISAVFLLCLIGIIPVTAQTMLFPKQVEIANTRSGNHVRTLYQDSRGFIWAGSMESLVRYDGFSIKNYQYSGEGKKPVELIITSITEDKKGNIWCTSLTHGILVLPVHDKGFGTLRQPNFKNSLPKAQKILFDNKGNIWGTTLSSELFSIRTADSSCVIYPIDKTGSVQYIIPGSNNDIWYGGNSGIFYIKNAAAGTIQNSAHIFPGPTLTGAVDSTGGYFCSYGEIYKVTPKNSGFEVNTLARVQAGNTLLSLATNSHIPFLAVFTRNNPLLYIDKNSGAIEEKKLAGISFSQIEFYGFHLYAQKNLYICTNKGFLSVGLGSRLFSNYTSEGQTRYRCVKFISPDTLLFGTAGSGLFWYARDKSGQWHNFKQQIISDGSPVLNTVNRLYTDKKGALWAGTNGGVYTYHAGKWAVQVVGINTWSLTEDNSNNLWLGSNLQGLVKYDRKSSRYVSFMPVENPENEIENNYNRVWKVQYYKNKIYLGTAGGMLEFDPVSKKFIKLFEDKLQYVPVWDFLITDSLWIIPTQGQGLWTYSPYTKKLSEIEVLNSHVYSMSADTDNNYWFINDKGILHWDIGQNKVNHYTGADGLSSEYFSFTGISSYNNQVVFCGENGFTVAAGKAEEIFAEEPQLWISSLEYGGDEVADYLPANSKIVMSHTGSKLVFDIAASLIPSGKFKLYYKLEGVDADWQANEGNSISYSHVKPGNYVLTAHIGNDLQKNTTDNYRLFITIQPPFWQTWWFKSAVILIISGVIFYVFYAWIRNQKLKQAQLKSTIEALRSQINPHFVFNSLNSIQAFIYQEDKLSANEYLSKFARLIRIILENSREEYISVEQERNFLNLYLELEAKRFNGALTYSVEINNPGQTLKCRIPSMLMQPLVENSVKHGFSPQNKTLHINVFFGSDSSFTFCEITDNGQGFNARGAHVGIPHTSLGVKLIKERLETLSKIYGKPHQLVLENRTDAAKGAYAKLNIPKYDTDSIN